MKTIFCPACGEKCGAVKIDPIEDRPESIIARCPNKHQWSVLLDFAADTPDGTSCIAFQCDGTPAYELPEAVPS